jgi:hypothetical protein
MLLLTAYRGIECDGSAAAGKFSISFATRLRGCVQAFRFIEKKSVIVIH